MLDPTDALGRFITARQPSAKRLRCDIAYAILIDSSETAPGLRGPGRRISVAGLWRCPRPRTAAEFPDEARERPETEQ